MALSAQIAPLERFALSGRVQVQETAGLAFPEVGVVAAGGEELGVGAFLDDLALFEHDEPIHRSDGRERVDQTWRQPGFG